MVDRINIVTLIILLFLSVGRAFVRADTLMVVNSVMQNPVIKPDEWREVYRWVLADKNVPDRKEVLMLIRYHYGNFGKLTDLLCYLNEGRHGACPLSDDYERVLPFASAGFSRTKVFGSLERVV